MTFYVALTLTGRDGTPRVGESRSDVRADGAEARERAIDAYAEACGVRRSRVWPA